MKYFLQGMAMGIAEGAPGVSASTLALLLGIYEKFIGLLDGLSQVAKTVVLAVLTKKSWGDVRKDWQAIDWKFAVPFAVGTVIALFLFAVAIEEGFEKYPMQVYAAFFGLSLASVSVPLRKIKWTQGLILLMLVSSIITFFVLESLANLAFAAGGFTPPFIFFSGFLAICGMLLPGVGGSFILLVLGIYGYIYSGMFKSLLTGQITLNQLFDLLIFIAGLVTGLLILIRALKVAMSKHQDRFLAVVLGILVVSLRVLWPYMKIEHGERIELSPKVWPWQAGSFDLMISVAAITLVFLGLGLWISYKNKEV